MGSLVLDIGLDVGSTTVKIAVLDESREQLSHDINNRYPELVFEDYQRHHADIKASVLKILEDAAAGLASVYGSQTASQIRVRTSLTGSAGLGIASAAEMNFVQEVIAETEAINHYDPEADIIIELGGEDAKITYLKPTPEQRMNGTCAGGTGAFIDQMATLLKTDATGLNNLAANFNQLYPIASRCGVFAKTDLQPLINDGAPSEDLAASIFQAVATQTIAGLACGRPIRGNVVFLGGPLYFLPELRSAFVRALNEQVDDFKTPANAQLYVAIGAALLSRKELSEKPASELPTLAQMIEKLQNYKAGASISSRLDPLFKNESELVEFQNRHSTGGSFKRLPIEKAEGAVFLGIDAGSTTIKAVLIDEADNLLYEFYASNEGDPVNRAVEIVKEVRGKLPRTAIIARSCVTGYGEGLLKAALHIDDGEVETVAHYEAAEKVSPGVTSIIDIGGQDMKYLTVGRIADSARTSGSADGNAPTNGQADSARTSGSAETTPALTSRSTGVIDSIAVNEACSSGCGSFLQTFAIAMNKSIQEFASAALTSTQPVDLGSRCTVFMNSSVKQAQKEGASLSDISAGLSYSVVKNALYKVIKLRDPKQLGENIVVQGGTFLNDAVLRAFELLTGQNVTRPEISGLMGAFGAALIAKKRFLPGAPSKLLGLLELDKITIETEQKKCPLCPNSCSLTISHFNDGASHVTGNRCERGGDATKAKSVLPNLFDYKYRRTFNLRTLTEEKAKEKGVAFRGVIGIPRVLNMYENYPFWHTLLGELGFQVKLSPRSNHALFEKGMDSIASENICYPAKLVHGHIISLLESGIKTIFYPCVTFEQKISPESDNDYNCPIVANYPQVIANNVEQLSGARKANNQRESEIMEYGYALSDDERKERAISFNRPEIDFIYPYFSMKEPENMKKRIFEEFARFGITEQEAQNAVDKAFEEDKKYKEDIKQETKKAIEFAKENGKKIVVLASRPYHVDPEVNHGIPEAIASLGMCVLSEDGAAMIYDDEVKAGRIAPIERPLRVTDQWAYHTRLYKSAKLVAVQEEMQLVQLNSFGCGLDAVTTDQTAEILQAYGDIYTVLKIDEVSNLGAAKIRLRSLAAAANERTRLQQKSEGVTENNESNRRADNEQIVNKTTIYGKEKLLFTKEMKKKHKVICPQMHPVPFRLIRAVFDRAGYDIDILEKATKQDIETGLKYVNNDSCYPAIIVIGQLVNAFESGKYDPKTTSVVISQTGGMCRATNYVSLLRLALHNAGYGDVVVLAISTQQLEKHPGFKFTPSTVLWAIRALFLGDLLQDLVLRCRPYEKEQGSTDALYWSWNQKLIDWISGKTRGKYRSMISKMVKEFDELPLKDIPRKPRVGVVGEILVKYHPDANNRVLDVIESEGCEAVLPGMIEFMTNKLYISKWNWRNLARGSKSGVFFKPLATKFVEIFRRPIDRAFEKSSIFQGDNKFKALGNMHHLIENAQTCTSLGVQAGEGWLLTGEIVELIKNGVPNVVCANPFACLPNHVTGRGMFQEIRRQHPQANVVSIDYDPGASEVNQLNRIKLMITTAKEMHAKQMDNNND